MFIDWDSSQPLFICKLLLLTPFSFLDFSDAKVISLVASLFLWASSALLSFFLLWWDNVN